MMLKPFRLRHLHGQDAGVVQITSNQYTSTINSQPDATLTYLDDDDGEVITVGSAFELEQRLDEPVCYNDGARLSPMHIFDIQQSAASLAVWREHEAYSSKILRKTVSAESLVEEQRSKSNIDVGMWTTDENGHPYYDRSSDRDPYMGERDDIWSLRSQYEPLTVREDEPRSPILNLSVASITSPLLDYTEASVGERGSGTFLDGASLDIASMSSPEPAPREDFNSAHQVLETSLSIASKPEVQFDKFLEDALHGLDMRIGNTAAFLENTAASLRKMADNTRKADVSKLEVFFGGFKSVLSEVGTLGRGVLEQLETEASSIVEKLHPLPSNSFRSISQPTLSRKAQELNSTETHLDNATVVAVAPKIPPRPPKPTVEDEEEIPEAVSPLATPPSSGSTRSTAFWKPDDTVLPPNFTVLRDCPPPLPRLSPLQYPQRSPRPARSPALALSGTGAPMQGHRVMPQARVLPPTTEAHDLEKAYKLSTLAGCPERNQELYMPKFVPASALKAAFPTYPVPPPMPKSKASLKFASLAWEADEQKDEAKQPSILDSETPDPDFALRYPPLMSLRRAKTVGGLNNEYQNNFVRNKFTTQAALTRYPSIDQFESRKRSDAQSRPKRVSLDLESGDGDLLALPNRPKVDNTDSSPWKSLFEQCKKLDADIEKGDPRPNPPLLNISRPVPGGWPETANEIQQPIRKELNIARDTQPRRPFQPLRISPDAQMPGFRYVESNSSKERNTPHMPSSGLHRSHTVAASNPAARLSTPFDPFPFNPLALPRQPHTSNAVPLFPRERIDYPKPREQLRTSHRPFRNTTMPGSFDTDSLRVDNTRQFESSPWSNLSTPTRHNSLLSTAPPRPRLSIPPRAPTTSNPHFLRHMRSEPQFEHPKPTVTQTTHSKEVSDCIRQLKTMGFGIGNTVEASMLEVYANLAQGDVMDAVEMIEDDRKAHEFWPGSGSGAGKITGGRRVVDVARDRRNDHPGRRAERRSGGDLF